MKLQLTINEGMLAGRVFDLETGFLTIGRGENCSVRFDPISERIASKQHAFIEARPDGYYITDNNSTNGTIVNGSRIQKQKLSNGDTVQFGKNGVTASIRIEGDQQPALPREEFRELQLQQFEQAARATPDNLQNSMANIGLGQVVPKPEPSRTGRYIGIGITILAIVFLSLIVIGLMIVSVGPLPAVIAAVVAFTPAMLYLLPLMWLDRYDPEPLWLLALAFAWGALVAVVVSFIVNTGVGIGVAVGVGGEEGMILGDVLGAVVSAPVVEEASKGVGLLVLLIFFRRYFDDILDGIVFAGVIALGFATVENVLYYGRALGQGGLPALVLLFVLRGVLSPFAHVTFTAMTGIGVGMARESHNAFVKFLMPVIGYLGAVFLHALWNGMAVFFGLEGFLVGYLILEIPFFLLFVLFAFLIMWRQSKILKEMLAIDVARGLIPEEHAKKATSAFRSTGWLLGGIFGGKFGARSKYLRAIGSLGLSYWHIQRATAAQGQTGSFQQNPLLRDEVLKWRDKVD
ncbi:MAG: PrsW family glutamic-type intramembrane protease [Pyrinomonadaceae bacterium]|nr:PrsW family glutamic-type intramembrane protease [Pyrinomonadaceae bacterium]